MFFKMILFGKMIHGRVYFLMLFETCEQNKFISENFDVSLYPVRTVARTFEYSFAIVVVDSVSCGSDSDLCYSIDCVLL